MHTALNMHAIAAFHALAVVAFSIQYTFRKLRVNPKFQGASVTQSLHKRKRLPKNWAGKNTNRAAV